MSRNHVDRSLSYHGIPPHPGREQRNVPVSPPKVTDVVERSGAAKAARFAVIPTDVFSGMHTPARQTVLPPGIALLSLVFIVMIAVPLIGVLAPIAVAVDSAGMGVSVDGSTVGTPVSGGGVEVDSIGIGTGYSPRRRARSAMQAHSRSR